MVHTMFVYYIISTINIEVLFIIHRVHTMFIAALFIIAKTWKQPRCPSVGEYISPLCYSQTMDYYSAIKINELSHHGWTWGNHKYILKSERNQSENLNSVWSHLHDILDNAKLWRPRISGFQA